MTTIPLTSRAASSSVEELGERGDSLDETPPPYTPALVPGFAANGFGTNGYGRSLDPKMLELTGGILVLARVRPSEEEEHFTQILLPIALSYETFLCKLSVALRTEKERVRKVLKLPDILIRSTEDVVRLKNWDKLELRLKRPNPWRSLRQKVTDAVKNKFSLGALVCLAFAILTFVAVNQAQLETNLTTLRQEQQEVLAFLRTKENSVRQGDQQLGFLEDKWIKKCSEEVQKSLGASLAGIGTGNAKLAGVEGAILKLAQWVKEMKESVSEVKSSCNSKYGLRNKNKAHDEY